ncbi:MAG: FG-GAP repeat domain-containing protein, partial [Flavobacteriales bacterium]
FKRDADFPKIKSNGKCVSVADWDKDGDQDVFIGSHARPGLYPQNDPSFFLENKSGKLVNVSESICSATLGMVTDAKWGDLTGNNVNELVLVGEWMSPTVLEWKNGAFESSSLNQSLKNTIGWWWTVEVADVNGDGVQDLVAGNIGANNKFHPSNDRPLRIYGNDFDGNGTNDVVLSKMYKDKFVPVRGRECSSEQMPFVKEKFKNFESFSQAKIEEVLGAAMNDALFYEAREFRSGVFINSGFGDFTFDPFDNFAQLSAIKAIKVEDFSGDGVVDILLAGNHYGAEVETARYDASNGLYLHGEGSGKFRSRRFLESGFYAPGNVVDLELVNNTGIGKPILFVISNNGPIMSYVAIAK